MKCSVCGNDIPNNSTRCNVCGTIIDKESNLKNAMSNISSLAKALKTKREEDNIVDNSEKKFGKVSTKDEEIENFYSKEINFKPEEDEIQEDFDLNAFYEQAKAEKLKKKQEKEEALIDAYTRPTISNIQESSENEEINNDLENYENNIELENEDNTDIDKVNVNSTANLGDNNDETKYSDSEELDGYVIENEQNNQDSEDEGFFIPEFEEDTSSNVDLDNNLGYIKESEIVTNQEENDDFNLQDNLAGDNKDVNPLAYNDLIKPTVETKEENNLTNNANYGTNSQDNINNNDTSVNVELGKITPEKQEVPNDEFASVKAEDVPYTQLEDSGQNKATDNKPIVIEDKDVIGLNNADPYNQPVNDDKKDKKEKKKVKKFAGIMSIILFTLAILATGIVILQIYVLSGMSNPNVVFDAINQFLGDSNTQMYVILGSVVAGILSIIFALCQLLFVKPRKFGNLTFFFAFIFTAGIIAGYYFTDNLLPMIDFVKNLFG